MNNFFEWLMYFVVETLFKEVSTCTAEQSGMAGREDVK